MKEVEEISQAEKVQLKKEEEILKIIRNHNASNSFLDLAARSMMFVPEELYMLPNIQQLYLESNLLEELPDDFFESLPRLTWLDLRDNKLADLPSSIGNHRNLKNVLLERNQITHLPLELGNVQTITGLSLRGNPLILPPPEIVEQGVQVILSFLLEELNNVGNMEDMDEENEWDYENDNDYYPEDGNEMINNNSPYMEEKRREHEAMLQGPTLVPAMFHRPNSRNKHTRTPWRDKRFDNSLGGSVRVNNISLVNGSSSSPKTDKMEYQNKLALSQQRKKNSMVLDEWRQEAKKLQTILLPRSRTEISQAVPPYGIDTPPMEARPVTEEERRIHFDAVEEKVDRVEPKNAKPKSSKVSKQKLMKEIAENEVDNEIKMITKMTHNILEINNSTEKKKEETIKSEVQLGQQVFTSKKNVYVKPSSKQNQERMDSEVQARIRQHTSQLRTRKQKNDNILKPGRELQRELLEEKMSRDQQLEYRFRAFTGDSSSFSSSKKTSSL
uniref:leucine-rich repeat-containing protein 27-like isoform X1 n=1 Tax=Styela clava TaxID=7725 RepID=UPI00193A077D|nr:leucine-rich repeat-containing protein 27-like isoform X1 [Styela clava]